MPSQPEEGELESQTPPVPAHRAGSSLWLPGSGPQPGWRGLGAGAETGLLAVRLAAEAFLCVSAAEEPWVWDNGPVRGGGVPLTQQTHQTHVWADASELDPEKKS